MSIADKIKTLFQRSKTNKVETVIIKERQCPHCVSRGLFVFSPSTEKKTNGNLNENSK